MLPDTHVLCLVSSTNLSVVGVNKSSYVWSGGWPCFHSLGKRRKTQAKSLGRVLASLGSARPLWNGLPNNAGRRFVSGEDHSASLPAILPYLPPYLPPWLSGGSQIRVVLEPHEPLDPVPLGCLGGLEASSFAGRREG